MPPSESSDQVVLLATDEARILNHSYVGTEHILLALLREPEGRAASALATLGINHERVRAAVIRMMGVGVEADAGEVPLTGAARAVIERADQEASALGADTVGSEHILLALVSEPAGAAGRILGQLDVDAAAVRSAVTGPG